ncbi:hypothetical protein [Natronorubrum thiooxidans]|uniref:C2H2-type domain-containing protein n=1 Tax=Natronorubrum thiooxidans TaxID=308853 RepID=A0A1N7GM55_9EURY|nr:hypothetical protein [Natronorubrum thiooxidans]SIS13619.1 hypothetical protein SAMN05421752_11371 [Natronorubrum thiooxidans]
MNNHEADENEADEFVCGICDERFDSADALEKHIHEIGLVE